MAYTITKSDGTILTTISDGTVNSTSSSLSLPGRNYNGYGQYQNVNSIRQLENFASANPPKYPLKGQLWFNTNDNTLRLCPSDGTSIASSWLILTSSSSNGSAQLGNITVSGNITANNVTTGTVTATTGAFNAVSVSGTLTAYNANLTNANIGNLTTTVITTGSPSTPGTMTGDWTIDRSIHIANVSGGNPHVTLDSTGIKSDAYKWANGVTIFDSVNLPYSNVEVRQFMTSTTPPGGPRMNLFPDNVTASGNISVEGNITSPKITTSNIAALVGNVVTLTSAFGEITDLSSDVITASNVTIDKLVVTQANVGNITLSNLTSTFATITQGTVSSLNSSDASIGNLSANVGNIVAISASTITSPSGNINTLNSSTATIINLTSTGIGTSSLSASTGTINSLNSSSSALTNIYGVSTIGSDSSGATFQGTWTLSPGATLQATYADLAERYHADAVYEPGTVVKLGGEAEITATTEENDTFAFGVVSNSYAHLLNASAGTDETHPAIALTGRVSVNVIGPVKKFDKLVATKSGLAKVCDGIDSPNVIGTALEEDTSSGIKKVLAVVRINM